MHLGTLDVMKVITLSVAVSVTHGHFNNNTLWLIYKDFG